MSQLAAQTLLDTGTVTLKAVVCRGELRHKSAEEFSRSTHLVFPFRGVYVRHLGSHESVAEANQLLFFNNGEACRVSHPVPGGDASLSLWISKPLLLELAPREQLREGPVPTFKRPRLRIDPRAQALVALL